MTHYTCDRCHQSIEDKNVYTLGVLCYNQPTIPSYVTDGTRVNATAQWCRKCVDHFGIRPYAMETKSPSIEDLIRDIIDEHIEDHQA